MKLSELKKQIKDNIYEILSEESVTENFGPAVQSTDPKAREIEDKINKDPKFAKQIAQIIAQAEKDKKMAALKQFIKKPELVKAFKERDVEINTGGLVG